VAGVQPAVAGLASDARRPGRVGYQGEPGAYSEEALLTLFPNASPVGHRTFTMAFDALQAGAVDVAVIPVENTLGGIVQEANDLLWERAGLRLVGEHAHPVRHCLLGFRDARVERAMSHPQALAQTRRYLEARGIEAVPHHDTAGAARDLAERPRPGLAAIASAAAARRYGLEVLAEGIQDDDTNQTRFVVVERGEAVRPGAGRTGSKCSLCFVAAHEPGSLVAALQCLSTRGVNLTRLEARPIPTKPFEYRFFLDFQVGDPDVAETALRALESSTHEVRLFGTYGTFA
jgi:prephenate dehydratase